MKLHYIYYLTLFSTFFMTAQMESLPKIPSQDTYFGKKIIDEYQYSEDINNPTVDKWFKESEIETRKILNSISGRQELLNTFLSFEKRKSFSISYLNITENNTYFYLKKEENDITAKLYLRKSRDGKEVLLFDPKDYKKGSTDNYIINFLKPSWDAKTVALGFSKNGEETGEIAFLNIEKKSLNKEIIKNTWPAEFGIDWAKDNSGIYYLHIPIVDTKDPNYILDTALVYYKIGDKPETNQVILSRLNNTELNISNADFPIIEKYDYKDKYLMSFLAGASNYSDFYFTKVNDSKINWKPLFKKEDKLLNPVIYGEDLYVMSSNGASNFKILKTTINNLNFSDTAVIIPENEQETIINYIVNKNGLVYCTSKNGVESNLYILDNNKKIKKINLPFKAGAIKLTQKDKYSEDLWVSLSGWTSELKRYKYNFANNSFTEDNLTALEEYPEFKDFKIQEIEIPSHDGQLVPVSIIYNKELNKNKNNNVLLYGYGAYGTSMKPRMYPVFLTWVSNGGILVIPHVRGGGEKGDQWHLDGLKEKKSNTWKDLIAVAEFLIKDEITNTNKIAALSGSAGGVLVGRAITERPDLFKVMMCHNGLLNPLRIDKAPNGPNTMKEFGNPSLENEFNMLLEADSYYHIKNGIEYPACLISVGMNDARVAPWMSGKFIAKIKSATTSKNPILFTADYNAGHGMDSSVMQLYNNYADQFAFALWQFDHPKFQIENSN